MSETDAQAGRVPGDDPFRKIVWSLAIAETIIWASLFYSFPALLLEWERDFGWSKSELTGAFTLALIVSATFAPIAGRLIDHGYSRLVFCGSTLGGVVLLLALSRVHAMWQFYLVWLMIGVAMAGALYEPCFAILTRSMGPRARRAITLVTLVAGFAGTVSFPSAHVLVNLIGWRAGVCVFAAAVLFIALPLVWIGSGHAVAHGALHEPKASKHLRDAFKVLRNPVFWLLAVSFGAIALNHSALVTHLLPLLNERGVEPAIAVFAASMIGPMQVAGRLAMMAAERYVSIIVICATCFIATLFAALSLLGAGTLPLLLIGFVVLQGSGYGVTSIVKPVVTAELLGRADFGVVSGSLAVFYMGATALAPLFAALVWEFGGYDRVIWLAGLASLVGLVSLLAAVARAQH